MRRRGFALGLVAAAVTATAVFAVACSSFGEADTPADPSEAGADAAEVPVDAGPDAPPGDAAADASSRGPYDAGCANPSAPVIAVVAQDAFLDRTDVTADHRADALCDLRKGGCIAAFALPPLVGRRVTSVLLTASRSSSFDCGTGNASCSDISFREAGSVAAFAMRADFDNDATNQRRTAEAAAGWTGLVFGPADRSPAGSVRAVTADEDAILAVDPRDLLSPIVPADGRLAFLVRAALPVTGFKYFIQRRKTASASSLEGLMTLTVTVCLD